MDFKKNKEAQSAIEFMILVGVVLFAFSLFFLTINENISDKIGARKNLNIKIIAITIQDEINLAHQSSEGYQREFKIPVDLRGEGYEVNLLDGTVYVKTLDNKYSVAFPIANVSGDVILGTNIIKKENGVIKLNE